VEETPMRMSSGDGPSVELRPLRYQFGRSADPRDWDANWFSDPCLTTWEARELGSWLRGVRSGEVEPTTFGGEDEDPSLVFTEPNIAFSLARRDAGSAALRVHLSLESAPPWERGPGGPDLFDFFVEVDLTPAALAAAQSDWGRELAAFPVR
jgi:hypothetical protein